jgi:hypothetical protein
MAKKFTPHLQLDRNSYGFFIWLKRKKNFKPKVTMRNIVVTLRPMPMIQYRFVKQMVLPELRGYITYFQNELAVQDYRRVALLLAEVGEPYFKE